MVQDRIMDNDSDVVDGTVSIADLLAQSSGGTLPATAVEAEQIIAAAPPQDKSNLISQDNMAANIIVNIPSLNTDELDALQDNLSKHLSDAPAGVEVTITGSTLIMGEAREALTGGRAKITIIGILLVFAGILILFRFHLMRSLLAIIPIILIIGWSALVMYLMGIKYTPLTATFAALILGMGAEYTIIVLSRYDEERSNGFGPADAMITAMKQTGRAISVSAITTIAGFAALVSAWEFPILQDFGILILIDVFFALVSTVLVLPSLIVWLDQRKERRLIKSGKKDLS
jgi:predicted RND superfamily exporter protein